ncbi:hypothetical protein NW063_03705 [Mycoplasmopsis cynos]|uniref:hypothetical protein n=1 Tax=Mycoplasmopsis cynos TaxID=171284 RepID=UPI0021FA444C|nr:hypothetical protein [Mycoplasmopsis cynos]UWV85946.1 hypothetical protein NW063_03705 [Mycoplasmopsis cynos]
MRTNLEQSKLEIYIKEKEFSDITNSLEETKKELTKTKKEHNEIKTKYDQAKLLFDEKFVEFSKKENDFNEASKLLEAATKAKQAAEKELQDAKKMLQEKTNDLPIKENKKEKITQDIKVAVEKEKEASENARKVNHDYDLKKQALEKEAMELGLLKDEENKLNSEYQKAKQKVTDLIKSVSDNETKLEKLKSNIKDLEVLITQKQKEEKETNTGVIKKYTQWYYG